MKVVSTVYGSGRSGVNRAARGVFSGGVQADPDITKLLRPKEKPFTPKRQQNKTPKSKLKQQHVPEPGNNLFQIYKTTAVVETEAREYYPPITGEVFDFPRNLALHLISGLANIPLGQIENGRSHFTMGMGLFCLTGAFNSLQGNLAELGPRWGCAPAVEWEVRSHCGYKSKRYCEGESCSVVLTVIPSLLLKRARIPRSAIRVRVLGDFETAMHLVPEGYDFINGSILFDHKRMRTLRLAKTEATRFKRILGLIREMAEDVSRMMVRNGSVSVWRERKKMPIDKAKLECIDPYYENGAWVE